MSGGVANSYHGIIEVNARLAFKFVKPGQKTICLLWRIERDD